MRGSDPQSLRLTKSCRNLSPLCIFRGENTPESFVIDLAKAAHMELAQPSIEQAFDRCVAAGAQKIVLHPFFLSPGRHVTSDIPELIAAAAKKHPEVAWVVSEPLGLQELMPRVMHAAVSESVEEGAWQYGGGGNC